MFSNRQDSLLFIYKMFHLGFSGKCKHFAFSIDFGLRVFSHDTALNIELSWLNESLKIISRV